MIMDNIPPYNFSKLDWRTSTTDSTCIYRDLSGGELWLNLTNRLNDRNANIFLVVLISIQFPAPRANFRAMAIESWIELRSKIPIIASRLEEFEERGRDGEESQKRTCLTYTPPRDSNDAWAWADRTVRMYEKTQNLEEARYDLGMKRIPEETGDGTILYIVPQTSETSYGLIIHADHALFDGSGVKILMTEFLNILAKHVGNHLLPSSNLTFNWGDETYNITPSAFRILGDEECKEGPEYEGALVKALTEMYTTLPVQYGFRTDSPIPNPGPTRHILYSFPVETTEKLLRKSKAEGKTLNQIAHAALCLLCIEVNPPNQSTPQNAALVFQGIVNGRSRLLPEYRGRLAYPSYCIAGTPITIPVSTLTKICKNTYSCMKRALLEVADIIKEEYTKQKNLKNLMAITPQLTELVLASMPPGMQEIPWITPGFVGDGIGETYLDPTYQDSSGRPVMDVQEFFLSVNYQAPGPSFRAFSWRDKLTLSLDFNENLFKKETAQILIVEWRRWIENLI